MVYVGQQFSVLVSMGPPLVTSRFIIIFTSQLFLTTEKKIVKSCYKGLFVRFVPSKLYIFFHLDNTIFNSGHLCCTKLIKCYVVLLHIFCSIFFYRLYQIIEASFGYYTFSPLHCAVVQPLSLLMSCFSYSYFLLGIVRSFFALG